MEPLFLYSEREIQYTVIEPSKIFFVNACRLSEGYHVKCINDFFDEVFYDKYEKESFDMIICSSLLHEVPNPPDFCKSILVACNKNTVIHINVPNANSLHRIIAYESGLIEDVHTFSSNNIMLQQNSVFDIGM